MSDDRQKARALFVAATGTFLVLLAYTLPLGALDSAFAALGAGPSGRAWIVSSMSVGLAAALLASGAIADAHGRRRLFVSGALVLTVASVGAAVAPNSVVFIAARVLQGIGGAAVTSCSLGILGHMFPEPAERTKATALWGASLGAGIAAGPLVSALLDALISWRAGQWLCAGAGVLVAVAASRLLMESRAATPKKTDVLGTVLLVLGLSGLLGGLVEGRTGWSHPRTLGLLAVGAASLVGFVVSQATRPGAMLDLRLFRRADFVGATLGALANGLGIIALVSFFPVLMSRGLGHGVILSAAMTLAWSGASVVSAIAARRLPNGFTPRHRLSVGLLGVCLGQLALGGVEQDSSPWRLLPGLLIAGLASGVLNATLARQAVASVPQGSAAMGSGANNTARYLGAAFGIAIVAMLIGPASPSEVVPHWNIAVWVTAAFSAAGGVAVFLSGTRSPPTPP